jgi:hypothetical protein
MIGLMLALSLATGNAWRMCARRQDQHLGAAVQMMATAFALMAANMKILQFPARGNENLIA